jgi:hypothetical protein
MSAQILGFFCMNGLITAGLIYVSKLFNNDTNETTQIDYLMNKICNLERQIISLNQTIEDMEDKFIKKENHMMKSTCELNSRLEDFINYNYNVLE